jgi:hypothetical protein
LLIKGAHERLINVIKVSRFGVNPKPTVIVRMKEDNNGLDCGNFSSTDGYSTTPIAGASSALFRGTRAS